MFCVQLLNSNIKNKAFSYLKYGYFINQYFQGFIPIQITNIITVMLVFGKSAVLIHLFSLMVQWIQTRDR